MDIVSIAQIEMAAVDAADAGIPAAEACRWPAGSEAADIFNTEYQKRAAQLEDMKEPA